MHALPQPFKYLLGSIFVLFLILLLLQIFVTRAESSVSAEDKEKTRQKTVVACLMVIGVIAATGIMLSYQ